MCSTLFHCLLKAVSSLALRIFTILTAYPHSLIKVLFVLGIIFTVTYRMTESHFQIINMPTI